MKKTFSYRLNIFLFLLPALILFVGILIAPIAMSAYYSLNDFNSVAGKSMTFVWLDNYKELFSRTLLNPETGKTFVNDKFMGDALVKLRHAGKVYAGKGISTDIIGAAIRAYLNALNKITYEEEEA